MKNSWLVLAAGLAISGFAVHADDSVITLPKPALGNTVSLKQALETRRTDRKFSDKELSKQELSNLLWAANGINRPNGKRTMPAAMGRYAITLYVALEDGIYMHNVEKNTLTLVNKQDMRSASDGRKMGTDAAAVIVMKANRKVFPKGNGQAYIAMEAGAIMQNIYLYCASANLDTVVCGSFKPDVWQKALNLNADEYVILTQVVGYAR